MMKSQVAEKYVSLVQGMNVGWDCIRDPLLFALAMNRLTDGVKHESLQMTGQNVCVNKGEILEVF